MRMSQKNKNKTKVTKNVGALDDLEWKKETGDPPPNNGHNQRNAIGSGQRSTRARRFCSRLPNVRRNKIPNSRLDKSLREY